MSIANPFVIISYMRLEKKINESERRRCPLIIMRPPFKKGKQEKKKTEVQSSKREYIGLLLVL